MKKLKTLAALSLALVMMLFLLPVATADNEVCFTAVNDMLNTLTDETMPAYIYGEYYVPLNMFNNTTFYVRFNYDRTAQKLMLYKDSRSVNFDMEAGTAVDHNGIRFRTQVVYRNSRIYVPVSFVCGFFGFEYSIINTEYGDIIRVKNEAVLMEDESFAVAAAKLMKQRREEYLADQNSAGTQPEQLPPSPPPVVSPPDLPGQDDTKLYVFVEGIGAGTDEALSAMSIAGIKATFFLSAEDIKSYPGTVRRILGEEHRIGIVCEQSPEEYAKTADLLQRAARTASIFVNWENDELAKKEGLIAWQLPVAGKFDDPTVAEAAFQLLPSEDGCIVALDGYEEPAESVRAVVKACRDGNYIVAQLDETVSGG